jgi:hypothetical protein
VDPEQALEQTLLAIRSVARAGPEDALVERVEGFLRELPAAATSPAGIDALRAAVDDWLAQMVGPLLGRVSRLLATNGGHDPQKVLEVPRALWVLLGGASADARAGLAEVGGLLSSSLEERDLAGAQRALAAVRAWLEKNPWEVAARLRRSFGGT